MKISKMKKSIQLPTIFSKRVLMATVVTGALTFTGCSDGAPKLKDASESTVYINTKGIEAIVDEVDPGEVFKITEENVLDSKEASRAIVHNLDSTIDTISMATMTSEGGGDSRRSALRSTLMGGLAFAYLTGRTGGMSPKASSYKNTSAFNNSNGKASALKGASTARKVSVPGKSSKGYGAGKSFRSFGG